MRMAASLERIPLIRVACPTLNGRICFSFCRASVDSPSKHHSPDPEGIVIVSKRSKRLICRSWRLIYPSYFTSSST